jgi:molecular chaperone DnaJ
VAAQREWFETDYYKILGVRPDAPEKEVTRAYRKLAKQHHPDANPGHEDRFKEISAAYDVLGDPEKRKEYDEVRRLGAAGPGFGQSGGFNFNINDLSDLFGGVFRQSGGRRRAGWTGGPRRGGDVEAELHLAFAEAVDGVVTTVNVTTPVACRTCGGSGSKPGTMPVVCPRCGGSGVVNDNQGLFSLATTCEECHGRGTKVVDPCATCFGTGLERRERQVKVRVPAGVEDGKRIRVKGRGEPGRDGGPAGDLFVTLHVTPHPLFGRRGRDLTLNVPVTYPEAALGATITVPSLGRPVTLKIPPGTKTGQVLRVRGKGLQHGSQAGDLLVTVELVVPAKLSDPERKAIEALAQAAPASPRAHLGV